MELRREKLHEQLPWFINENPYVALSLSLGADDNMIKNSYMNLARRYHPDYCEDQKSFEEFLKVAFAYSFLSDDYKKARYDFFGPLDELVVDWEVSLSNLADEIFAPVWSKLGVPSRSHVLEAVVMEASLEKFTAQCLRLGTSARGEVKKNYAQYFSVDVGGREAERGIVVRVTSVSQSKFKLLYFCRSDESSNPRAGPYELRLQENSVKLGDVTSAGMYFLNFCLYRMDTTLNALSMAKDQITAFFRKLEGFQPATISALIPGTHMFAVYGEEECASYAIEALSVGAYDDSVSRLKDIESKLMSKMQDLRLHEAAYREMNKLLEQRNSILSSFTVSSSAAGPSGTGPSGLALVETSDILTQEDNRQRNG